MREITVSQAIREAIDEEMARDERVCMLGEDIVFWGNPWHVYEGLHQKYGDWRIIDTPISEQAIVGAALGAAVTGLRPIAELQFIDFTPVAMDQIVNQAAKLKYMTGGQVTVPLVITCAAGAGVGCAAQHSQSLEAWFVHVPGLKVVMPSTPYDAKGLLKSAIRDDNPVLYIDHKGALNIKGPVPDAGDDYLVPLGKADVKRKGKDVTIVATSLMVFRSLEAAEVLATEGISVEVIDPRTLKPLDVETIVESVKKTGKLVIVHEACKTGGVAGELLWQVVENCFSYLDATPRRIASMDIPVPYSRPLEHAFMPSVERIVGEVREVCSA